MTHEMCNAVGSVMVGIGGLAVSYTGWRLARLYDALLRERDGQNALIGETLDSIRLTQEQIGQMHARLQEELDALYETPITVDPVDSGPRS